MSAVAVDTTPRRSAALLRPKTQKMTRLHWFDLSAAALLLLVGVLSFGPIFSGGPGFRAAGGGVVVGLLAALVAAWRRWSSTLTIAVSIVGYFAFGGIFALPTTTVGGVLPTLDTIRRLAVLTVDAWRDLLTVSTPASSFTGPAVVPYLSGIVCAVVAGSVALRAKVPVLAAIPALCLLVVGILWGTKSAPLAAVEGVTFAVIALAWSAARRILQERTQSVAVFENDQRAAGATVRRAVAATAVLGVASLIGVAAAPAVLGDSNRYTLRDDVVPPLDLHQYASPLTDYRYLERNQKQVPLLTVTGLGPGERLTLAVMDTYDGNVFNVDGISANYLRIGDQFDDDSGVATGETRNVSIRIDGYSGVWLPGGGVVRGVSFDGNGSLARREGLFYNPASGTLLTTAGVDSATTYDVREVRRTPSTDAALQKASIVAGQIGVDTNVPDEVSKLAGDWTASAKTPLAQLRALESHLRDNGFYSNGSDGKSRAGHTTERLTTMLEGNQLIGDDEQYAAVMTLMAHSLGIPARVVMGMYPDPKKTVSGGTATLTGNDAHVWVEVPFADGQWARFDPTPDRSRTPNAETTKPKEQPLPQVLPPPVPPKDKAAQPDSVADGKQKSKTNQPQPGTDWAAIIRAVVTVVAVGGLLAAPFLLILWFKARRRKHRRMNGSASDQISGAWAEMLDRATDLGFSAPPRATRRETAEEMDERFPGIDASAFARQIDAKVFGSTPPGDGDADQAWEFGAGLITGLGTTASRWRRIRAAVSLRSVLQGARSALKRRTGDIRIPRAARLNKEAA